MEVEEETQEEEEEKEAAPVKSFPTPPSAPPVVYRDKLLGSVILLSIIAEQDCGE